MLSQHDIPADKSIAASVKSASRLKSAQVNDLILHVTDDGAYQFNDLLIEDPMLGLLSHSSLEGTNLNSMFENTVNPFPRGKGSTGVQLYVDTTAPPCISM